MYLVNNFPPAAAASLFPEFLASFLKHSSSAVFELLEDFQTLCQEKVWYSQWPLLSRVDMVDTVSPVLLSHLNLLVLSILRWTCCSLWFSEQARTVKLQECGGCCSRRATRGDSSTPFISTCPFVFFLITNPLAIWCMHYSFQPWSTADINTESLPKMCRMSKKKIFFFTLGHWQILFYCFSTETECSCRWRTTSWQTLWWVTATTKIYLSFWISQQRSTQGHHSSYNNTKSSCLFEKNGPFSY